MSHEPSAPVVGPLAARRVGVLLHVTSLPGGRLGDEAFAFVDFLAAAGVTVWQVLPLVPPHEDDGSPYNSLSVMAGSPELVDPTRVPARGPETDPAYDAWCVRQAEWLEPYVEFMAIRELTDRAPWPTWEPKLRDRDRTRVEEVLAGSTRREDMRFEQWVFAEQWRELREYAATRGIVMFGDLPIFVSADSADVWATRDLFELDATGKPITVTGVPPDYFAADGQKWNNPHYDWKAMAADGFGWWRRRIARQRELFDLVRIDHFRGFAAAWHVPVDAPDARGGWWVPGPGHAVLEALVEAAGPGALVAEDLGVITPDVVALRDDFGLPGMKVLQFAFDGSPDNPYLPEHQPESAVVYTGTHDNDTTLGWWSALDAASRARVREHLVDPDEPMPWALVRLALSCRPRLAVVPAQDLLALGSSARMNTPGTDEGNWDWQADPGAFTPELAERMRALVVDASRVPPASA